MFIRKLLPLGMFNQFQNILHLRQRLFQGFNDAGHFLHGLTDSRTRWRRLSLNRSRESFRLRATHHFRRCGNDR